MTLAMPPFVISMFTDSLTEADFERVLAQNRKISGRNAATLVIDHAFPLLVIASEVSVNAAPGIAWAAMQINTWWSELHSHEGGEGEPLYDL
ncbi:hypothetical protein FOXG_17235 [Fusarium oxysporum f. sp. lycopersici 4287]|uniref:Uncharacterized protein n=1 Tax=Fusarium oxysporum f. sp. lycopersici (strain 4287 / CBS 123668 / FGSC 9935 / NRRL 34936) TaxID=426428 RepID=A0A0J9WC60_FUSO4|nr:hypothetical protein FOXG_17235 [Fusarium oxysporum f. sp. lycopersici 4287]KAJ9417906.1 hypothetical protein QL093DRAFT_1521966 [Fusarium oxysporum]KNB20126.1 hypothetical protein FOXG_17235 [Fusarium oxysporum f. sp. lycopersici 4287]